MQQKCLKRSFNFPEKLLSEWREFHKPSKDYSPSAAAAFLLYMIVEPGVREALRKLACNPDVVKAKIEARKILRQSMMSLLAFSLSCNVLLTRPAVVTGCGRPQAAIIGGLLTTPAVVAPKPESCRVVPQAAIIGENTVGMGPGKCATQPRPWNYSLVRVRKSRSAGQGRPCLPALKIHTGYNVSFTSRRRWSPAAGLIERQARCAAGSTITLIDEGGRGSAVWRCSRPARTGFIYG